MSAALKLEVFQNGQLLQEVACDGQEIWVGRDEDCGIRLEDRAISRKHALIRMTQNGVEFEKKSKFGQARISGRNIDQVMLKGGECVELGEFEIHVKKIVSEVTAPLPMPSVTQEIEPVLESEAIPEVGELQVATDGFAELPSTQSMDPSSAEDDAGNMGMDFGVSSDGLNGGDGELKGEHGGEDPFATGTSDLQMEQEQAAGDFDFNSQDADGATRVLKRPAEQMKPVLEFPDSGNFYELNSEPGSRILIGRSNCHLEIEDKKSSRKHAAIENREGKFFLKDLGSSNGTLVNGERVDEHELVSGDEIQIGDTKFYFKRVQADFEEKKQSFLQVPEEPAPAPMAPPSYSEPSPAPMNAFDSFAIPGIAGVEPAVPPQQDFAAPSEDDRNPLRKFLDYFRTLPVRMQIIYTVGILAGVYMVMDEDTPQVRAKMQMGVAPKKVDPKKEQKKGPTIPTFESLTPEQQAYIDSEYKISFEHYKNRDYDSCLLELGKIFSLVQDYKNAREIEAFAKEGKRKLEAQEEERKRKEAERQAQIKLQSLIDQAGLLMDQKKYKEAEAVFPEIELLQPENAVVANWKKRISDETEKAEAERIERERIARIKQELWNEFHVAEKVIEQKKYFESLDLLDALLEKDDLEPELVKAANAALKKAEDAIAAEREPLLAEGKKLEAEGKQTEAYRAYQQVLKVDPTDTDAPAGMARIRGALNAKAKSIYSEGVIAEGFGDFDGAEKKYREVLDVVPSDNDYYLKANGRIKRLTAYRNSVGGGASQ